MTLAPGPIVREEMPFGPRVAYDGLFASLAGPLHDELAGSDAPLAALAGRVGDDVPSDLDAAYVGTIGLAEEAHATEVNSGAQSVADVLIDRGGDVDALRGDVLRYLPQPETPIPSGLIDPPDPSVITSGRGFDTFTPGGPGSAGGDDGGGGTHADPNPTVDNVRALYRELLEREPDNAGLAGWVRFIDFEGHTLGDVRAAILNSDEYRQKHGG